MTNSTREDTLSLGGWSAGGWVDTADPERAELVDVLFRRHYTALLRLAVVVLGSREAAEDTVQDAFLSLHRRVTTLRDPDAAEAYLRSAVLNRCRSWVRRQAVRRSPRPLVVTGEGQPDPEQAVVSREESTSLVAAMRTLPRRQREVLACRYVLGLSVVETARLLEIGEGSVKSHTHRGLRALQQRMEAGR